MKSPRLSGVNLMVLLGLCGIARPQSSVEIRERRQLNIIPANFGSSISSAVSSQLNNIGSDIVNRMPFNQPSPFFGGSGTAAPQTQRTTFTTAATTPVVRNPRALSDETATFPTLSSNSTADNQTETGSKLDVLEVVVNSSSPTVPTLLLLSNGFLNSTVNTSSSSTADFAGLDDRTASLFSNSSTLDLRQSTTVSLAPTTTTAASILDLSRLSPADPAPVVLAAPTQTTEDVILLEPAIAAAVTGSSSSTAPSTPLSSPRSRSTTNHRSTARLQTSTVSSTTAATNITEPPSANATFAPLEPSSGSPENVSIVSQALSPIDQSANRTENSTVVNVGSGLSAQLENVGNSTSTEGQTVVPLTNSSVQFSNVSSDGTSNLVKSGPEALNGSSPADGTSNASVDGPHRLVADNKSVAVSQSPELTTGFPVWTLPAHLRFTTKDYSNDTFSNDTKFWEEFFANASRTTQTTRYRIFGLNEVTTAPSTFVAESSSRPSSTAASSQSRTTSAPSTTIASNQTVIRLDITPFNETSKTTATTSRSSQSTETTTGFPVWTLPAHLRFTTKDFSKDTFSNDSKFWDAFFSNASRSTSTTRYQLFSLPESTSATPVQTTTLPEDLSWVLTGNLTTDELTENGNETIYNGTDAALFPAETVDVLDNSTQIVNASLPKNFYDDEFAAEDSHNEEEEKDRFADNSTTTAQYSTPPTTHASTAQYSSSTNQASIAYTADRGVTGAGSGFDQSTQTTVTGKQSSRVSSTPLTTSSTRNGSSSLMSSTVRKTVSPGSSATTKQTTEPYVWTLPGADDNAEISEADIAPRLDLPRLPNAIVVVTEFPATHADAHSALLQAAPSDLVQSVPRISVRNRVQTSTPSPVSTTSSQVWQPVDPVDEAKFWSVVRESKRISSAGQAQRLSMSAQPGVSYPNYKSLPKTSFSCDSVAQPGYYADEESDCQGYHRCDNGGGKYSFFCTEGTRFSQVLLVCDHWYNVNCKEQLKFADYINSRANGFVTFPAYDTEARKQRASRFQNLDLRVPHATLLGNDAAPEEKSVVIMKLSTTIPRNITSTAASVSSFATTDSSPTTAKFSTIASTASNGLFESSLIEQP